MSRGLTLLVVVTVIFLEQANFGTSDGKERDTEPRKLSEEAARALAIFTPAPRYPIVARASHISDVGDAVVSIDVHTGFVKAVDGAKYRRETSRRRSARSISVVAIQAQHRIESENPNQV
jgi:hypothetical protein